MKIVLISDTHEKHNKIVIPPCDLLIHAGDLTMAGRPSATAAALEWLDAQPAKHVAFVAGNHDFFFQDYADAADSLLANLTPRLHYLENSSVEIEGLKIWGSPWTPKFYDWAFMYDRATSVWDSWIPEDVDILITHGPPLGTLDTATLGSEKLGCYDLARRVKKLPALKLHVFGHIHGGYGYTGPLNGRGSYNASVLDEKYRVANKPWEVWL